jgi:N-methylhydantoinase A
VIVPQNPGAFSALGVLLSDIVYDTSQSVLLGVDAKQERLRGTHQSIRKQFAELERKARREVRSEGFSDRLARIERRVDVRYEGQSFELSIPYAREFAAEFHRAHERAYGYADPERALEAVNLRLRLVIPTVKPSMERQRLVKKPNPTAALLRAKPAWFGGRFVRTAFFDRARLRPGMSFRGPAVVTEYTSTTVVPPDYVCRVDEYRNLVLKPE